MASEVDGAVAELLPDLLATATALTGSPEGAAELVGEVLVRAGRRSERLELSDPEVGLRNLVVARYVLGKGGRPPVTPPEPELVEVPGELVPQQAEAASRDEVQQVVDRLDRLTRPQRAALLLTCRDRLTFAEIAGIVDRPVGKVSQWVSSGQAALDATPYAIAAAFERVARAAPDPGDARSAAVRFGRRQGQRRRRVGLLSVVAVLALALAVLTPTIIVPRLFPIPVRVEGDWVYGYDLQPPPGLKITQRFLEQDQDTTYLVDEDQELLECSVVATVAIDPPVIPAGTTAVRVNGRPGWYFDSGDPSTSELTWRYAPTATATASCNNRPDVERLLLALASAVKVVPVRLTLPYKVAHLPAGYKVYAVGTFSEVEDGRPQMVTGLLLSPISAQGYSSDSLTVVSPRDRPPRANAQTIKVNGTDALLGSEDGDLTLCLPVKKTGICLSGPSSSPRNRSLQDPGVRRLVDLAGDLTVVADPNDRSTWFDARESLPH